MRARRLSLAAALGLAVVIALGGIASGDEVTRASYREAVEPICKTNTKANERIFDGVRGEVRRGQLKPAARSFDRAAMALQEAIKQLRAVPRPPADEVRLNRWLNEVSVEVALFRQVAQQLRAENSKRAGHLVVRLTTQANAANSQVIPFQFRFCKLEPSRFT